MKTASVTVKVADLPEVKAELERLRAENAQLREVLDDIYPSLASRAMQLKDAGETVAADRWSSICRQVASTWKKP